MLGDGDPDALVNIVSPCAESTTFEESRKRPDGRGKTDATGGRKTI
ncbi:hypothetical protein AAur_1847 [Paenarthrobacter aurescens TC1]|jgi:hypothetical protein|uniref:Uncharacterized protein n=1 Tax=Paenarthrobacter aurescens (strain TC1) TaxID=290340 RepID=A1R5T5_PAEAT|nr:hypothetical protein AAur_1847 [Paenarthrobacter aurescens TC1]